jgi:hypothetical protein
LLTVKDPLATVYKDSGCKLYPVCLECPLPRCIEEMPNGKQHMRLLTRAIKIDKLYKQGKSISEIASLFKLSDRTIHRSLSLLK